MTEASLHQFISTHRDAILASCVGKIQTRSPDRTDEELATDIGALIDEILHGLEREAGLPASSPLPDQSPAAKRYGAEQQTRGYAIQKLALDLGTISDSTGELASHDNLSFSAAEYRIFNVFLDNAISLALERFSQRAREQQEDAASQRLGFIAHELRNALSTARMAFAVLRQGQVGVTSKTGDMLDRSHRRLERLVSQTLLAAQLNAGVQLQIKKMEARALLCDMQESAIAERGIRIITDVAHSFEFEADETLLVSAISNLLQNAIKFTKAGGRVTLRARREEDADVIEIEDECGGLPPGNHEELFIPFVTRGGGRRGIGLGLAITRQAIEAHGGKLSVRDLPGTGCIFTIKLPPKASLQANAHNASATF
jgi:signal transduction histidine kinase